MKHKVSELVGSLLNGAVAKAEGCYRFVGFSARDWDCCVVVQRRLPSGRWSAKTDYISWLDWELGGPLIEREGIAVYWRGRGCFTDGHDWPSNDCWVAGLDMEVELDGLTGDQSAVIRLEQRMVGPTPLIAAMRAYVASKFGNEVEL